MNNNQDEPAFPTCDVLHPNGQIQYGSIGLTKREYFAAMAMQGLLAHDPTYEFTEIASDSVKMTDALIAELNK